MNQIPLTPRLKHDFERSRGESQGPQAAQQSAMAVALAQIEAAFGEAAAIGAFKQRVGRLLRLGPEHAAMRARFGARAEILSSRSLDAAIILVERRWRDERKAFQIANALGYGMRLSLEILSELRLILRLMRFKRMEAEYYAAVAALCHEPIAAAAE